MGIIFKYIKKADNSVIGYHLDTFCQCGARERAKVYGCETADEIKAQMEVIENNFNSMFKLKEGDTSFLAEARLNIRNTQYPNLTRDEIVLGWEDSEKEYNPDTIKATMVIENGLERPVNMSLKEALTGLIGRMRAKLN